MRNVPHIRQFNEPRARDRLGSLFCQLWNVAKISSQIDGRAIFAESGMIFLADNQDHAGRIGIWAAGGVLVGTGVGIVQVAADESRANTAVSQVWSPDPAPTYRLALFRTHF